MRTLCLREAGCDRFGLATVIAAVNLFQGIDHRQDKPGPKSASQKGQHASPPAHPRFSHTLSSASTCFFHNWAWPSSTAASRP